MIKFSKITTKVFSIIMLKVLLLSLIALALYAQEESLSSLLNNYKEESDLSKITKQEAAGIIDIFTRSDLEKMQVKTLNDVFKLIGGLHTTRQSNNIIVFSKPSSNTIQLSAVRLYINDHDMSSSSFGSAFLIWGELPIEYIDHIEVYKGSSSIEFGNETATLIIRLYTKKPQRELGSKVRVYADNKGSLNGDIYNAGILDNGMQYFAYANVNNIKRTTYHNYYASKSYNLKSNHQGHNLFFNLLSQTWSLEVGSYVKEGDNLLGIGIHRTPTGGNLNAYHHYLHITKKFPRDVKLELSYDNLAYDRSYQDENGIQIANAPLLTDYNIKFHDTISSIVLEKLFHMQKHSLLLGSFYKHKTFQADGDYSNNNGSYNHSNSYDNALNIASIYTEYTYKYDNTLHIMASAKGDFLHYKKAIASTNESIFRLGVIKQINNFRLKAFLTKSYVPTPFCKLYNPENMPYKTNPDLKNMRVDLASIALRYKKDSNELHFIVAKNKLYNVIVYDKRTKNGYKNTNESFFYTRYQLKYIHTFDKKNKIIFDAYTGNNSKDIIMSPKYSAFIQLFNTIKKFDLYNELIYKSSYSYPISPTQQISVKNSFDYTLAIKYHYSNDLSFGLRGENLFHDTFEQAYRNYQESIPVNDQKVWVNMEYLF
jgi:iron complex outermembrane receptor protein